MECEEIHSNHKIITYGKIIPNKIEIEKRKKELIEKIEKVKEDIKGIINK